MLTQLFGLFFVLLGLLVSKFQMDYWQLLWGQFYYYYSDDLFLIIWMVYFAIDYTDYSDYMRLLYRTWIFIIHLIAYNANKSV